MTTNTKIIIGFSASAVLALAIYFIFKKKNGSYGVCSLGQLSGNGYTSKRGADGELCQSFLGASAPRGVKNNNAGNIKFGSSSWLGKIPLSRNTDSNKTFEQFETYAHGIRAMLYTLDKNYIQKGYNTIRKLISRYDNPQATHYMDYVSTRTNIGKDTVLLNDKATLKKLVQAMAKLENDTSKEIITNAQFETAWKLYKG
jgi:hypothetical protein